MVFILPISGFYSVNYKAFGFIRAKTPLFCHSYRTLHRQGKQALKAGSIIKVVVSKKACKPRQSSTHFKTTQGRHLFESICLVLVNL